jgi:hypothetical protein
MSRPTDVLFFRPLPWRIFALIVKNMKTNLQNYLALSLSRDFAEGFLHHGTSEQVLRAATHSYGAYMNLGLHSNHHSVTLHGFQTTPCPSSTTAEGIRVIQVSNQKRVKQRT